MQRRLEATTELTVDQVAQLSRTERGQVLRAISNRSLRATQRRGEWVVLVGDMRRWLSRA